MGDVKRLGDLDRVLVAQLNEQDRARQWYARAIAWVEKEKRQDDEELRHFRTEAEDLLTTTDKKPTTKPQFK